MLVKKELEQKEQKIKKLREFWLKKSNIESKKLNRRNSDKSRLRQSVRLISK